MTDPKKLDSNFGRTLSVGSGPNRDPRDPHGDYQGDQLGDQHGVAWQGIDALKHPLLRLAVFPDRVPEPLAELGDIVRIALDPVQKRAERLDACLSLRENIGLLRLDPATAALMLRDVLDAVALGLESPTLDELRLCTLPFDDVFRASDVLGMSIPALPPSVKIQRLSWSHGWIDVLKQSVKRMLGRPASDSAPTIGEAQAAIRLARVFIIAYDREPDDAQAFLNERQAAALGLWVALEGQLRSLGADRHHLEGLDGEARLGLTHYLQGQAEARASKTQAARERPTKAHGLQTPSAVDSGREAGLADATDADPPGTVRVIKATIPASHGKEEKATFERYEVLRQPLALPPMPDAERLRAVIEQLEREFPWATAAVHKIGRQLISRQRAGSSDFAWAPLLLVGPPGCGKSRFAERLTSLLGLLLLPISLAGAHDTKALQGTSRGWSSSQPSPLIQFMLTNKSPRFVVLLDEVEKTERNWGYPTVDSALLPLLERQTAANLLDPYLQVPCDMSKILYIATANDLGPMSMPLLSRFTKVEVPVPKREHFSAVAPLVLAGIAEEWGVPVEALGEVNIARAAAHARNIRELRQMLIDTVGSNFTDGAKPLTDSKGSFG